MRPGPDDHGEDRNNTIVGCARETEEPLAGVARRTELIGLCRGCPDIRTSARRADRGIDCIVVARLDRPDRTAKGKCVRNKGNTQEKDRRG